MINPHTQDAYKLLHNGILALARAEQQGIRVDVEYVEAKKAHLTRRIDRLEKQFKETNFFDRWKRTTRGLVNIHSPHQLSNYLYRVLKLEPPKETSSGQGATDEDALKQLRLPELDMLLDIRKLRRVRDTYLGAFVREQVNGYIHPFFNLHLVRTYRSCVAKGTPILVARDFIKYPEGVPIEEIKEGDNIYCFDNDLNPTIQKVLWAGKTGYRKVIRVHYVVKGGGGKGFIDVTPEHKIRLLDGRYVEAQKLTGDWRLPTDNKKLPKIRTLSCKRVGDSLRFTGHLKHGNGLHESHFIYSNLVGPLKEGEIIHHKNLNHLDHSPSNLEKTILPEHSRYHSKNVSEKVKQIRIKALNDNRYKIKYKSGFENHNSLKLSKYSCYRTLAEASGMIAKVKYDFETFKKYLQFYGIDPWQIRLRYDLKGKYIWRSWLKKASLQGRSYVGKMIGHNHYHILKLYSLYNIPSQRLWGNQFGSFKPGNHIITKIEWLNQKVDVYDIEVEKYHNFFANQICVHNSSDSPNFQNIPKRDEEAMQICRTALYPRPGHQLLEVDYSGLEVRIAACYHKDPAMLKYITDPRSDMHADMAVQIFILDGFDKKEHYILRQAAKNGFVFPEFYGDYYVNCANFISQTWCGLPQGRWKEGQGIKINGEFLSDHLISKGITSLNKFTDHIKKIEDDFWTNRFADYATWKDRWYSVYKKHGYLDMLTGFRCSGIMSRNDCINYPVQGAAFHCLLWSFIELDKELMGMDTRLIGQIHDSMILDVNPNELQKVIEVIKEITCKRLPKAWEWIIVPLDVDVEFCDVDKSWAEKRKF